MREDERTSCRERRKWRGKEIGSKKQGRTMKEERWEVHVETTKRQDRRGNGRGMRKGWGRRDGRGERISNRRIRKEAKTERKGY